MSTEKFLGLAMLSAVVVLLAILSMPIISYYSVPGTGELKSRPPERIIGNLPERSEEKDYQAPLDRETEEEMEVSEEEELVEPLPPVPEKEEPELVEETAPPVEEAPKPAPKKVQVETQVKPEVKQKRVTSITGHVESQEFKLEAQNEVSIIPNEHEQWYIRNGWRKYETTDKRFTAWVPAPLMKAQDRYDPQNDELYQAQKEGVYYGIQRRPLKQDSSTLSDVQARWHLRAAFEEWKKEYAEGIPGLMAISRGFVSLDGNERRFESLLGAENGQIQLRIIMKGKSMAWVWSAYRHESRGAQMFERFADGFTLQGP